MSFKIKNPFANFELRADIFDNELEINPEMFEGVDYKDTVYKQQADDIKQPLLEQITLLEKQIEISNKIAETAKEHADLATEEARLAKINSIKSARRSWIAIAVSVSAFLWNIFTGMF